MRAPSRTVSAARRLRRAMTLPEVILWTHLRHGQLDGMRFRRQHPVGPYVLDFFCTEARLCVEVDGAAHDFTAVARRDERRDHWLASQGIRVLRIAAADILRDDQIGNVLAAITEAARSRPLPRPSDGPPPPLRG